MTNWYERDKTETFWAIALVIVALAFWIGVCVVAVHFLIKWW